MPRKFGVRARASYRRGGLSASAAFTFADAKPLFTHSVTTATVATDLTDAWETDLGRETLSPTIVRCSGKAWIYKPAGDGNLRLPRFVTMALFVGPSRMDVDDFPDPQTDIDRFMYTETLVFASDAPTATETKRALYASSGMFRIRNNFQKRLKPGDHLWLISKQSIASDQINIMGEVKIGLKLR